jgi:pimeloyl-ACP methyl ester carboxylesterase
MQRLSPPRLVLIALVAAAVGFGVGYRSWIGAQARAVVALSTTLETPLLTWAVTGLTDEPRVEDVVVVGVPATLARPGGDGPWPVFVFLNGATERGRAHPDVQRLARGLARAGFLVLVPDLPGLVRGELSDRMVTTTVELARAAAERQDATGRVALFGASLGATVGLLAATVPELRERVSVVVGIAPYTDLVNAIRLATTGYTREGDRIVFYGPSRFLSLAVARSVVAGLPASPARDALARELASAPSDAEDPLAPLRRLAPEELEPPLREAVELPLNRDPARFDRLYAALPDAVRVGIERLSPITHAHLLSAPVELASAPRDSYFPPAESHNLARAAQDVHVVVTAAFSHVIPKPSLADPADLVRFNGWAVRSLEAARG